MTRHSLERDGLQRPPELELEQPEQIAEEAAGVGRERLDRSALDILLTSIIGGGEVSLGGLAAMAVAGAALGAAPALGLYGALALGGIVFPIGLLFVVVGRSELFTENFLVPVLSVFKHERSLESLGRLWSLSLLGNLAGCAASAALIAFPDALGEPILRGYRAYAEYKLFQPLHGVFVSAIVAGAVMSVLTWLLTAVQHAVGRMALIFAAGYLLFAPNLSHSIVGASQIFVGFTLAGHTVADVLLWTAVAAAGNLVGGVVLVTLFRFAQASEKQRQR